MAFLGKPQRALCLILLLCTASFYIIQVWGSDNAGSSNTAIANESFTVTQRFYGVDAEEMERIAAIPLEDALSGIRGLQRIVSSSENGRTRVFSYFEGKEPGRYEAVREAVQQVYESLPSSAQRPEISSSGDSRIPVWTAALSFGNRQGMERIGTVLEKNLKPALEGLPGVGNVEISGTGLKEIVITLKAERAAALKIDASDIAAVLAGNDVLLPGGTIRYGGSVPGSREIPVMVDGRYGAFGSIGNNKDSNENSNKNIFDDLKNALIPVINLNGEMNLLRLQDLAEITEQERNHESRSRLDGKEAILVAMMGSEGADLGRLSLLIKKELEKFPELEFSVLSDRGEVEREARSSALGAAFQGALMVALLCFLLCFGKWKFSLVCSLTVPVSFFFAAALLILFGFSLDKLVLAGLAAGIGAAVDSAILGSEFFRSCRTLEEGKAAMKALRFPLASGALTTAIALLPLMAEKTSEIHSVAWAVAFVNMVSMILALTLLPPLFLWAGSQARERNTARLKCKHNNTAFLHFPFSSLHRVYRRKLAVLVQFVLGRPLFVICFWILLSIMGAASLFIGGVDVNEESFEDALFAQIEFEGGLYMEETDRRLAVYGNELKMHEGIKSVQTVARTGTGSALVSFDPRLTDKSRVRDLMRSIPVSGAFVYIVESSGNERSWRIRITGDEENRCRELAAEAARLFSGIPFVSETVLNFKEGSPRINLIPEREKIALNSLSFGSIGQAVRRGIHGPVAYKRIDSGGETDVRIRGGAIPLSREEVLQTLLPGEDLPVELQALVITESLRESASIQREDRRRSASISIRTRPMDPRKVRDQVMACLSDIKLPPGYNIEFDREALKAAEGVSSRVYLFIIALLFCYMVIAALKESFSFPLALLAVAVPSLSVPAFLMYFLGYPVNEAAAAAFVAVSGLAINAAALISDTLGKSTTNTVLLYNVFRRRLPVLALTTLTTVAAALPFLFIKNNAALVVKTLSLVSALGITVSALCAVTLIPALAILFPGILKTKEL